MNPHDDSTPHADRTRDERFRDEMTPEDYTALLADALATPPDC